MDNPIIHILVIWSKAKDCEGEILADLRNEFEILKIFNCHWDKDKFLQNYRIFYAHSQYNLQPESYRKLLETKIEHCGDGDFTVVILRDDHPDFEPRMTSSGESLVNARMFDKKSQYRELTGGGHKIHSSDNAWETNQDLTLMFGRNTVDFCNYYELDGLTESFSQNCQGVGGYDSIEQLFYVLNNTIRYVVLRNHECLPDQYTVEGHGDIDLLCDDKNWMAYLTGAKKVFPESYRVYHTITIGGKEVPFDFRYVGDNYYDQPWQEDILSTRVLQNNLFYTPNPEHQYYSLLYHAYIQKWEVKEDYPQKLSMYADAIDLEYCPQTEIVLGALDNFLEDNHYEYVRPKDISVVYNENNLAISEHWRYNGTLIKHRHQDPSDDFNYETSVYRLSDRYRKVGSTWLLKNEYTYTKRANEAGIKNIPHVMRYEEKGDRAILETSQVTGVALSSFLSSANYTIETWRSLLLGVVDILEQLSTIGIAHRDVIPQNILISGCGLETCASLIDFGWATELQKIAEDRPHYLAYTCAPTRSETDFQCFGYAVEAYAGRLCFVHRFGRLLKAMDYNVVSDQESLGIALKQLRKSLYHISLRDKIQLFLVHHRISERFLVKK